MKDMKEDKDYVPFGPEWEKQLMKYPKSFLIDLYRRMCLRSQQQSEALKPLLSIAESYEMCFPKKNTSQKKKVQDVIENVKRLLSNLTN